MQRKQQLPRAYWQIANLSLAVTAHSTVARAAQKAEAHLELLRVVLVGDLEEAQLLVPVRSVLGVSARHLVHGVCEDARGCIRQPQLVADVHKRLHSSEGAGHVLQFLVVQRLHSLQTLLIA